MAKNSSVRPALTDVVIDALEDIKAKDIKLIDVSKITTVSDYIAVASADSTRQTRALAHNVMEKVKEAGYGIYGNEGEDSGEWVLVDCGDVVVHIMQPAVREYYKLEELWQDGVVVFPRPKVSAPVKPAVEAVPSAQANAKPAKRKTTAKKPVASKVATTKVASKEPVAKKAAAKKVANKKPAAKKAAPVKVTAKKPAAKKPASKKAAAKKVAVKTPVAKKPTAKKVAAKGPAAKKVAAPKVTAKKPASSKVTAKKPAAQKVTAKKPAAKNVAAKKVTTKVATKKPVAKKVMTKKPAAKKAVAKKSRA